MLVIGGAVVGVIVLVLLAVVMSSSSSPRPAPKKKVPTVSEPDKPVVRPDDTTQRDFRGPGFVTPPPKKKDTEPTSAKGRYVRIELPGKKRILSLAEVEVFCKEENIAPKGKATQSSTSGGGDPARANDGNKNGDWKNGSITHTNEEDNPWWELDLGGDHDIRKVVVHNRMDEKGKLAGRLKDFTLKILDKDRKVVWQKDKVPAPNPYYVLFPK